MTTTNERTLSLQRARNFMQRLLDKTKTPRVPTTVREEAHHILRHYPGSFDLNQLAQDQPDTFGKPGPFLPSGECNEKTQDYVLKLSRRQAQTLVDACNLYSRIGIGQFGEIEHLARDGLIGVKAGHVVDHRAQDEARTWLGKAKQLLTGMAPAESYSIASAAVHEMFKTAWDLQQVMRHRLSWDALDCPPKRNTDKMFGVSFDDPLACSEQPLATMEQANDITLLQDLPPGFALARSDYGEDQKWHLLKLNGKATAWIASGESARSMVQLAITQSNAAPQ